MKITPIKTHKITLGSSPLVSILDSYLPTLKEQSIVVITSKVVSMCEGNAVYRDSSDKNTLIASEADLVLGGKNNQHYIITIKNGVLMPSAGIDPSQGLYVML